MVRLSKILVIALCLLIQGCLSKPGLLTQSLQPFDQTQWQGYGAVYEYDELRIEENYDEGYGNIFSTSYTFNQKLHILNKEGVDYGTLSVPLLTDQISAFEVRLVQQDGKIVELDQQALKNKFIETGEIAVPQVQPGSRISLTVTFVESAPLNRFEYWFERDIPVILGQFSFFHDYETEYSARTYNIAGPAEFQNYNGKGGVIIQEENLLPQESQGWKRGFVSEAFSYQRTPRVHVSLQAFRSNFYGRYDGSNWKEYARKYRDYILDVKFLSTRDQLAKIAAQIDSEHTDEYAKTDAILQYVQDNITITEYGKRDSFAVDIDEVIHRKSGDYLEISVVLREMLKMIGIEPDLYVTRSRARGGFDPELPGWGQLSLPLVSVTVGGKELIAYPFIRNAALGEYPLALHNQKALHLADGKIVVLPKPLSSGNTFSSNVTLELSEKDSQINWKFSLQKSMATYAKEYLASYDDQEQKSFFKRFLKKFDKYNSLQKDSVVKCDRGESVLLEGTVTNRDLTVKNPENTYVNLGPFFRRYYPQAEDKRTQPYINDLELNYEEGVTLALDENRKNTLNFKCTELDNALFRSTCTVSKENGMQHLMRKVTFKQANIAPDEWTQFLKDIHKLNEIKESNLIQ